MSSLGLNSSSWEAAVTASPEILQQEGSAKSVCHVLSTAVTRSPQKVLAKLVCGANFVPTLRTVPGQKIIQSLVNYGTVRTVALVCADLQRADVPSMVDAEGVALIIRAVALRDDDTSDARKSLLASVIKGGAQVLMTSKWSLIFAAEVVLADEHAFSKLVSNKKAQECLKESLGGAQKPKEAIHFVEALLSKSNESQISQASAFVLGAISDFLKPASEHKPREEVLIALAQYADIKHAAGLCTAITSWRNIPLLVTKPEGARLIAMLLSRVSNKAGTSLADVVLTTSNIKELCASRNSSVLSVITTLQRHFPERCTHHNVTRATLSAAEVKFTKATKPAFTATKDKILEKIRSLEQKQMRPSELDQKPAKKRRME